MTTRCDRCGRSLAGDGVVLVWATLCRRCATRLVPPVRSSLPLALRLTCGAAAGFALVLIAPRMAAAAAGFVLASEGPLVREPGRGSRAAGRLAFLLVALPGAAARLSGGPLVPTLLLAAAGAAAGLASRRLLARLDACEHGSPLVPGADRRRAPRRRAHPRGR